MHMFGSDRQVQSDDPCFSVATAWQVAVVMETPFFLGNLTTSGVEQTISASTARLTEVKAYSTVASPPAPLPQTASAYELWPGGYSITLRNLGARGACCFTKAPFRWDNMCYHGSQLAAMVFRLDQHLQGHVMCLSLASLAFSAKDRGAFGLHLHSRMIDLKVVLWISAGEEAWKTASRASQPSAWPACLHVWQLSMLKRNTDNSEGHKTDLDLPHVWQCWHALVFHKKALQASIATCKFS